jgi:hypothetical protein
MWGVPGLGGELQCRSHFNCLPAYGERWRSEATQALIAMGLTPPNDLREPSDAI